MHRMRNDVDISIHAHPPSPLPLCRWGHPHSIPETEIQARRQRDCDVSFRSEDPVPDRREDCEILTSQSSRFFVGADGYRCSYYPLQNQAMTSELYSSDNAKMKAVDNHQQRDARMAARAAAAALPTLASTSSPKSATHKRSMLGCFFGSEPVVAL